MKKKVIAIILSLSMAGGIVACGATDSAKSTTTDAAKETTQTETTASAVAEDSTDTGEAKNIMFVSIVTGGVAWGAAQKGFEDSLAEEGWTGQYVSPTTANDTTGVIQLLETAVTNKADGIITVILDTDQATDVLSKAKDAEIPVVTCNTYTTPEMQNCWIGTDPKNMGVTQAETALKFYDEKGNDDDGVLTACYIQTTLQTETQNEQFAAFTDKIHEKYPDAVLIQDECNSDAAEASDKLAALLKSYPEMDVVVSQDGYGAPGIANYVESEGLQDQLIVIGIDDSEEILNYVSDGALDCTIAQDFYKMGYESVKYLKQIYSGDAPEFANDSGTIVIGPDEVADHLELLKSRGLLNN